MNKDILREIEDFIIKGRIDKALKLLINYCRNLSSENYEEVVLLSTQFHIIERKERVGLGEFNREINRLAQSILKIVFEEKKVNEKGIQEIKPENNYDDRFLTLETKVDKIIELLNSKLDDPLNKLEEEYFWRNLENGSRNYLYTAEKIFNLENLLDYSSVIIQYSKTLESEFVNKIFIPFSEFDHRKKLKEENSLSNYGIGKLSFSQMILIQLEN